ncbi:WD repeat-containing protein 49 [Callorhinchus milii]|nr:WD repeat-containing protein 49 [Callorhinchus milii]
MMIMEKIFMPSNVKKHMSMNREEFIDKIFTALGYGEKEEYGELFDKIDAKRDGFVNWDTLTTFMMFELYKKEERVKWNLVPQWKEIKIFSSQHKEVIRSIVYLQSSKRYLSMSKDGYVNVWEENLNLQETFRVVTDSVRLRDLCATGMVFLANVSKIAVGFTTKEICFYDINSKDQFPCQYKLDGLRYTPICMHYWYNPEDGNEAILTFGDGYGGVNAMCFTTALTSLFEKSASSTDEQQATVAITWKHLVKRHHKCCFILHHREHNREWVKQVSYSLNLDAFISCSTTGTKTLVLAWKDRERMTLRITSVLAAHGINGFDYHSGLNLIASAGADNQVFLWNPYVISKPAGVLQGHVASVLAVQFNVARNLLFSFSKDKVLRVWDIQHQLCIQRLSGVFPKLLKFHSVLFFDEPHGRLFTTFNRQMSMLEMKQESAKHGTSHKSPVTCVLYDSSCKQVISSDTASTVTVWMIETGQKVKQFTECHGDAEITTMALNETETRLFTGSTDGTVKVWDFNGHCHHKLNAGRDNAVDISQILLIKRTILVVGWQRIITVFSMNNFTEFFVQPMEWHGVTEHQDDIFCAAFLPPQTLATGSYDGDIVIWNSISEKASDTIAESQHQAQPLSSTDSNARSIPLTDLSNEDIEWDCRTTRLFFLVARTSRASGAANLVSSCSYGVVRFWNTLDNQLLAEFIAQPDALSIIMTVDKTNRYLITADVTGWIKVWNIQEYCLFLSKNIVSQPPPLVAAVRPHIDNINHLETCVKDGCLLILSASADCNIAVSKIDGIVIGVFGQDEHWRIHECLSPTKMKMLLKEETTLDQEQVKEESSLVIPKHRLAILEEILDLDKRINWNSTILGKTYAERRSQRRKKPHPSSNKIETSIGIYSSLHMEDLEKVTYVTKPAILENPDKYFDVEKKESSTERLKLPTLSETLKAPFDERSLFPKEILECENRMKRLSSQVSSTELLNVHKNSLTVRSRTQLEPISKLKLGKEFNNFLPN